MKKHIRTTLIAASLCGAMAVVTADAYACKGEGKRGRGHARLLKFDQDGDGIVDRRELTAGFQAKATRLLQKADADGDALLDASELAASRGKWHKKRKKAQGPKITAEQRAQRAADRFAKMDINGDRRLDIGELQAAVERRVTRIIERLDKNGDGAIGKDELPARRGKTT